MENKLQNKDKGLGFLRHWKVMTMTLLLLTFSISQMWATDYLLINDNDDASTATLNTTDFWTAQSLQAKSNGGSDYKKCIILGGNISAGVTNINYPSRYISYGVKTTNVTITIKAYQSNNSAKKINIYEVNEAANGALTVTNTKEESVSKGLQTITFTATPAAGTRSTIYITSQAASNFEFYQVIASETGSALTNLVGGRDDYSIDYSKKSRLATKSGEIAKLDGVEYNKLSADYKPNNGTVVALKTGNYIKFNTIEPIVLTIVTTSAQKFYVAQTADGTTNEKAAAATHKIKLTPAGDWYIVGGSSSATNVSSIAFSVPTVSYDANGGGSTMSSNTWTVEACTFTAPSGKKFDGWKDDDDNVYTVGQEVLEDVTLYAQWKDDVAEYTVTYKDGESTLKSVNVAVGYAPDAYSPTKDFYTFAAWQKDAVDYDPADLASDASANDEITLTARWTAQYTSGTYEFTGHLTMGTDPQMTIANSTDGSNYDAGRIDNIYVSAQKIGYEATGDYGGWKLKTTNGTLRFMVENACGVRVTLGEANPLRIAYTEGGVAKTADIAKSTTSSVYKADANTLVTLTNITSGNKTVTLKKIEILPLYNVTYSDEKGDASGSDENVTEVTLPTPSATTVGSYSFTGWVANQTVYDGETPKTTGEALNAGGTYKLTATTTFTAQWALIADFDVKFFQGYGDPDVQIGTTQSISTGEYATAPTDPERTGFAFLGWSYDGTEAHIVDVATYGITAETNFTAMWKQVWTVTFDGAGAVNVEDGETVASPNSPVMAGKVFQGWYNSEVKYDFSAAVTGNLALTSKWADADPNHFYYTYNDDFHFDGVVYKTPDGKTKDPEAAEASNVALATNPFTLFSGASGITSIVATNGIYDYKKGAGTKHITAYLKLKADDATSNVVFTIASGYTAVLKLKMNGYSSNATISLKKGDDAVTPSGTQEGTAEGKNYGELTYNLTAGEYKLTTANKTLYISHIDLEATAIPAHVVTYLPGEATGAEFVIDNDATQVLDCPVEFIAPEGKVFNGWKDALDNDVAVDAIVESDMTLTAQWINHYAVTFNMNGHGDAPAAQDIKHGAKATRPDDPVEIGYDFGGWFTDNGTFEVPFDFNTAITDATPLYAKWTAFAGCTLLVPATSGDAPAVGDAISMQSGSKGGSMSVIGTPLSYNTYGLGFDSNSSAKAKVTINNEIQEGTVISLTLVANGTSSPRGLHLYTGDGATKITSLGWTSDMVKYTEETYTYTVQSTDVALIGTNEFQLWRNSSVFLKQLTVTNCGDPVIFHNLTSEIAPDHDPAYATVTLGASSVREGRTTTATYSDINAAYEFDEWQISGTGASIADASANPAVITMGTADAVVTLKLKVATVKHTVTFNTHGGSAVAPVDVEDGQKLAAAPSDPTKEDYIFQGWAETADGAIVDVTSFTISADKEFHAVWVAETGVIKLLDGEGNVNTTNFTTGVTAGTVNFDDADHNCANFGSTGGSIVGLTGLNKVVAYNATTTQTKVKFVLYNTNNAEKEMYLQKVVEGATEAVTETIAVPSKERHETQYYTFNSSDLRSFYVTVNSTNIKILQVKVVDDGAALKRAGEAGYELNLNLGRVFGAQNVATNFEGLAFAPSSNAKVLNSTELPITTPLSFTIAAPLTLKVTTSAAKYYVSQNSAEDGTTATAMTETGEKEFNLTATGTWYIVPSTSSAVKITNIAFSAPKCAEPAITQMTNVDLCEGAAFTPITVSASVSDGGTLHYQWYKHPTTGDDEAVGTDAASYTPETDGQYYVVVTNRLADHSDNSATSNTITVTHFAAAVITTAPLNQRGEVGDVVTLTVAATGKNVAYKWYTCDEDGGNEVALDPAETGTSINVTITAGLLQWYKVKVTSDCGGAEAKAKVSEFVPTTPANVTESIVWDWESSAWPASGQVAFTAQVEDGTDLTPAYELLADADAIVPNNAAFRSDMLYGKGQWVWRSGNKFFQGTAIKFTTEVAGLVRVNYRSTGNNKEVQVTIAGTPAGKNKTSNFKWSEYVEVPAGAVEILCLATDENKSLTRVQKIEFLALENRRTAGWIKPGELGTVCLENTSIVEGATIYELQGPDQYGKLVFDEVQSGEVVAGTPYLFEATATGQISFYKKVNAAHAGEAGELNGMHGTFSGETFSPSDGNAANLYYFSGNAIWCVANRSTDANIPAHGCYLNMEEFRELPIPSPTPAPGRRRITLGVNGKNTPTGIENGELLNGENGVQKVLINGELFILRGEKMYDATGRLVK